ncbi:helix-turn-helix transcriptional regulator [Hoeflea sp. YIM 152468]|uniref:transcriptional regulator VisN n=1 Tax=Hoeflea sp. YIM 152468 TaxID=3031759 RepID=UPI0023DB3CC2|nr:helix-turn-helix transcriptional regulator [Hoeflea sp. YIM 152468]MDF1608841.1 helix-turn-helix transcriptional regulator [Hoeflea sp. YIM 152468]
MIARGAFIHDLESKRNSRDLSGGMELVTAYAGARCYLLARTDLYSDRNHDFIMTSDWPFNLVRSFGVSLVDLQARTSEVRRCLQAFEPAFQEIDPVLDVSGEFSRRVCVIPYNAGQARLLLAFLFGNDASLSHDRLRDVALAAAYHTSHFPEIVSDNCALSDLTVREVECLSWIGEGKTSDEIALIIGISRNTVNNYITSIMNKTGAKTRSEAVAFAVRQRII